jgi:toxin ParE1/3/4
MKIIISPEARDDLAEIWLYIAARSGNSRADDVQDEVTKRLGLLRQFPKAGPLRPELGRGFRSYPVYDFLIIYRRLGVAALEVVRVIHGARNLPNVFRDEP